MMIRTSDPVWQQCLRAVEPVLDSLGFRLTSEAHHYALFGSASAEYERAGMRLELFWDGREHWIDVRYAIGDRQQPGIRAELRPLAIPPPSSSVNAHYLRPGQVADEYIENIVTAVRDLATGPRSST